MRFHRATFAFGGLAAVLTAPSVKASMGVELLEDQITMEYALSRMPANATEVFIAYKAGTAKAEESLTAAEKSFEQAQADKDKTDISCKDGRDKYSYLVQTARQELMNVETQLTLANDRIHALQTGNERIMADLAAVRTQQAREKSTCDKTRLSGLAKRSLAADEVGPAKSLSKKIRDVCASGGVTPKVIMCSLPGGTYTTTFEGEPYRTDAAQFSNTSQQILASLLDRAVRGHRPPVQVTLRQAGVHTHRLHGHRLHGFRRGHMRGHLRVHGHSHAHGPRTHLAQLQGGPWHTVAQDKIVTECTTAITPECHALADVMATFSGSVADILDEMNKRGEMDENRCSESLASYELQASQLVKQSSEANVLLANTVSHKGDLDEQRQQKRGQLKGITNEAKKEIGECDSHLKSLDETLASARKMRKEVEKGGTTIANFMGDCEVSDWVRGPCSVECGVGGGVQNVTREIVTRPKATTKCPSLWKTHKCNDHPCPVDGMMGKWKSWSDCTRPCGGGTRVRKRDVKVQAQHGGAPIGETIQEEVCNTFSCDADCILSEWTPWTNCSKMCNGGHLTRMRNVVQGPIGAGGCPTIHSPERAEAKPCNLQACQVNPLPTCATKSDIVLVLDSSGTVGFANWPKVKQFAELFISRVKLGEEKDSKLAMVSFAATAEELYPLTASKVRLNNAIQSAAWMKTSTNTAEGAGLAKTMFVNGRAESQRVMVIVTDGMPESSYLFATVMKQVKSAGIRVIIVAVGTGVDTTRLKNWVSWPWQDNFHALASYDELPQTKTVADLIFTICPVATQLPEAAEA